MSLFSVHVAARHRVCAVSGLVLLWAGCADSASPQEFWRPWYERSQEDSDPAERDAAADLSGQRDASAADLLPTGCTLSIEVTTSSAGGRYAPRNIGAIWISDASGRFVKTLSIWAEKRAKYLTRWNQATSAALTPGDRTDAISGATKTSHGVRSAGWNCKDRSGQLQSDGMYKVCFELTDLDGPGAFDCVVFEKAARPWTLTPADAGSFASRRLDFRP